MIQKLLFRIYSWSVMALVAASFMLIPVSWLASLYGFTVHNLLSVEGLRWMLRLSLRSVDNSFPFLSLLVICMGGGALAYSKWCSAIGMILHRRYQFLSYKQRWGIQISSVVGVAYLLFILWLIFSPSGGLLSLTGTFSGSPLLYGWTLLFWLGCILISGVYGWVTGSFRHVHDVVSAFIKGVQMAVPLFVLLFVLIYFMQLYWYVF